MSLEKQIDDFVEKIVEVYEDRHLEDEERMVPVISNRFEVGIELARNLIHLAKLEKRRSHDSLAPKVH